MKAGFKLCSGRLLWQGARKVAQFEDSAGLVFSKRDLLGWGWEERKDVPGRDLRASSPCAGEDMSADGRRQLALFLVSSGAG